MSDLKKRLTSLAMAAIFATAGNAGLASANSEPIPLSENAAVNNQLIVAGIVRRIHKRCPSLTYRRLRSFMFLRSIHSLARAQGYSADEIETYIDDKDQESLLYTRVDTWLSDRGAREGDAASYCAIGAAEMTAESQIGNFLRTE